MVLIESNRKATRKGGDRVNKWLQALLRRTQGEKGVTLIELLAVIVIIAVIAAIAVPVVLGAINNSKTNTAKQDMTVIAEALNRYAADHDGQFPASGGDWQELKTGSSVVSALVTSSSSTSYLQDIPTDPWDSSKHFWYYSSGTGFELITDTAKSDGGSGYKHLYMSNRMSTPTDQPPATNPITDHSW